MTDPKTLITGKQTMQRFPIAYRKGAHIEENITLPKEIISNLSIHWTIHTDNKLTVDAVLADNPLQRVVILLGNNPLNALPKEWFIIQNSLNPHLYTLEELTETEYKFSINLNIKFLFGALIIPAHVQGRLRLEFAQQCCLNITDVYVLKHSEKYNFDLGTKDFPFKNIFWELGLHVPHKHWPYAYVDQIHIIITNNDGTPVGEDIISTAVFQISVDSLDPPITYAHRGANNIWTCDLSHDDIKDGYSTIVFKNAYHYMNLQKNFFSVRRQNYTINDC